MGLASDEETGRSQLGRTFTKVWGASVVSALGDGVHMAALPLLAAQLTGDPLLIGAVGAASTLPWFLFALPAGALVDRWNLTKVMWRVDAARFAVLGMLAAVVLAGHAGISLVLTVAFLLGCGQVFFEISAQALVPAIVSKDSRALMRANGRLFAAQTNGERLVGPPLGAALFSLSPFIPFLANALSFMASSALIGSLKGSFDRSPSPAPTRRRLRAEVAEGLRWLLRHRVLRALAGTAAMGNIVFSAKMWLLVLLAHDQLGLNDVGYGLLLSSTAVGALLGSFAAPRIGDRVEPGSMRCAGMIVEGLCILGIGLTGSPWIAGGLMAVTGCSMSVQNVVVGALRQRLAPPEMLGRVLAASRLISLSGAPVGALLGGYLARTLSLGAPFVLGGVFMVVIALMSLPALSNRSILQATEAA
ncbi:MFS transporter [Streptomyces prunicolor]|uniref:MFS transporter n=1 Tax=Streptomyces prunicolor TaxID=67348 RepID=A0ABU4FU70_9ACTN|nr:MFS transporter [Streptomyces prunicolor]MCX5240989.1 MFS transporter [Streptomyces prunicolor]MCX5243635.1 MFS transporter [Streptomyces prunicolor]MDV7222830.1 MFS transporter [Streptomyces prunicolor]